MNHLFEFVKSQIESALASSTSKKKQKIFQKTLLNAAYANTPFLKYHLGQNLISCIMVMLQIISLFTTYTGANYYLRGINSLAPFLFAISIQAGLFYLANSYSNAINKKKRHFALLLLFTLISIVFSYTGMAVVSLPPEQEYNKTFEKYVTEFEIVKSQLISENLTADEINNESQNFINKINSIIQAGTTEILSLDAKITTNNDFIDNNSTVSTESIRRNGQRIDTTTSEAPANAYYISEKTAEYTSRRTIIQDNLNILNNILNDASSYITIANLNSYIDQSINDESIATTISANLASLINSHNNILLTLENTDISKIDENYFDLLRTKYTNANELINLTLDATNNTSANNLEDEISTSSLMDYLLSLFTDTSSADAARETLHTLQNVVDENFNSLNKYIAKFSTEPNNSDLSKLVAAKEKLDSYGDPNVQVLYYIFDHAYTNRVLGILILAFLIDTLTFILGLFNGRKKISLLNLDTNKELIDSEDHLFSIVFISLIGSKIPTSLQETTLKDFRHACDTYIQEIKNEIVNFLSSFTISPWTDQWGYGLYAQYKDLKNKPSTVPILSILQQLDYLKFVSTKDFQLIIDKFNGIEESLNSTTYKDSIFTDTEYICLLRYRAELYLYSNTAEISTMYLNPYSCKEES